MTPPNNGTLASHLDATPKLRSLLLERGGYKRIYAPGRCDTATLGLNDPGQIVGLAYDSRGGSRGFLLDRGVFTPLDGVCDATYTRALDVNNRGQIVGDYGTRPPIASGSPKSRMGALGDRLRPHTEGGQLWLS
jgi:uncharacterized membrane protein